MALTYYSSLIKVDAVLTAAQAGRNTQQCGNRLIRGKKNITGTRWKQLNPNHLRLLEVFELEYK